MRYFYRKGVFDYILFSPFLFAPLYSLMILILADAPAKIWVLKNTSPIRRFLEASQ